MGQNQDRKRKTNLDLRGTRTCLRGGGFGRASEDEEDLDRLKWWGKDCVERGL